MGARRFFTEVVHESGNGVLRGPCDGGRHCRVRSSSGSGCISDSLAYGHLARDESDTQPDYDANQFAQRLLARGLYVSCDWWDSYAAG